MRRIPLPGRAALTSAAIAGALLLTGLPVVLLVGVVAIAVTLIALVFALSVVFGPILLIVLLIIAISRRHRRSPAHWRPQY